MARGSMDSPTPSPTFCLPLCHRPRDSRPLQRSSPVPCPILSMEMLPCITAGHAAANTATNMRVVGAFHPRISSSIRDESMTHINTDRALWLSLFWAGERALIACLGGLQAGHNSIWPELGEKAEKRGSPFGSLWQGGESFLPQKWRPMAPSTPGQSPLSRALRDPCRGRQVSLAPSTTFSATLPSYPAVHRQAFRDLFHLIACRRGL